MILFVDKSSYQSPCKQYHVLAVLSTFFEKNSKKVLTIWLISAIIEP
nr:MAG TPA: hypothetical protein [Caudoviricetes sp.]